MTRVQARRMGTEVSIWKGTQPRLVLSVEDVAQVLAQLGFRDRAITDAMQWADDVKRVQS